MAKSTTATRYISHDELVEMASQVARDFGTQQQVAIALGVSQPAISQVLKDDNPRHDLLRVRIVRELGGFPIRDDRYWRID